MTNGMERLGVLRERSLALLEKTHSGALLLARLGVGLLFLSTGWGKVHSIPKVTGFFMSLGIPLPGLNAVVVAYSELLCGTALVVGLFARLATVPLIVSMIVAILTAKRDSLNGVFDLVGFDEFTYIVVLVVIAAFGPGRAAVDHFLVRNLFGRSSK